MKEGGDSSQIIYIEAMATQQSGEGQGRVTGLGRGGQSGEDKGHL